VERELAMRDIPGTGTSAASTVDPTDPELERLKLEKAKQAVRQEIAASQASALGGLAPGIDDAPKGAVTLGEKAGSLGPWLAHRVLAEAGAEIAASVGGLGLLAHSVVLVTDDADLLSATFSVARCWAPWLRGRPSWERCAP